MATKIYLGEPPARIKQWIIEHYGTKEILFNTTEPDTIITYLDGTVVRSQHTGGTDFFNTLDRNNIKEIVFGTCVTTYTCSMLDGYGFLNLEKIMFSYGTASNEEIITDETYGTRHYAIEDYNYICNMFYMENVKQKTLALPKNFIYLAKSGLGCFKDVEVIHLDYIKAFVDQSSCTYISNTQYCTNNPNKFGGLDTFDYSDISEVSIKETERKEISRAAFSGCKSLREIYLPLMNIDTVLYVAPNWFIPKSENGVTVHCKDGDIVIAQGSGSSSGS